MHSYTLTDTSNQLEEVFDKAAIEPVLLTQQSHPSHVLMSYNTYQRILERLEELEDLVWGQKATEALNESQMVGEEKFIKALTNLANGET